MCNADITPNVWRLDPGKSKSEVHFDVVHTCKSYDGLQQWTREHESQYFQLLPLTLNQTANDVVEAISHLGNHHGHGHNGME